MHLTTETFVQNSDDAIENAPLQKRLRVLSGFTQRRAFAFSELKDGEGLRDRARAIKADAIAHLDRYLVQLEESVTRLGGAVHWASEDRKSVV